MSEYWKSIPKKFCDVCKVWFQDNRASVEHHERGLRHKANVQKKLNDIRKRGTAHLQEQRDHSLEMMRIEAAAMNSFQKDVASDPSLAGQWSGSSSALNHLPTIPVPNSSSTLPQKSRFGEDFVPEESRELVRGRERALDTIAKKLEKKSKWLEAKSSEGDVYYWNRETLETVREKPRSGFLAIADQEAHSMRAGLPVPESTGGEDGNQKYSPYGRWQTVKEIAHDMPDLQLPIDSGQEEEEYQALPPEVQEEVRFEEKVVGKKLSTGTETFRKRPVKQETKRNVRRRESSP